MASSLRDVAELCLKLRPVLGNRVDALRTECVLDPQAVPDTLATLRLLAERHLGDRYHDRAILLPPPTAERASGEYPLGTVVYGKKEPHPFGLREDEWVQHVAIFGRSGSGKTNVAFLILKQLAQQGKPFLIFDWKRNYRDLVPALARAAPTRVSARSPASGTTTATATSRGASPRPAGATSPRPRRKGRIPREIQLRGKCDRFARRQDDAPLIHTVGRDVAPFSFNPLIPPKGTSSSVWLKKIIDILCQVYWLGEGVAYLFQKAMDACYREARERDAWPTFIDVARWLDEYGAKGREAQWMDSARRALQALSYAETGRVFNSPRPPPLRKLLKSNVIFELDALNDNDKTFFVESLLLWIHHYRMQQGDRETFKHAILIEEAHHVLLRSDAAKSSVMDVVLREIRELGEAVLLVDQHPSLISLPALGNTYCTICLNLKHSKDARAMSSAMLLGEEETKHLGRLPVGTGVVRLQDRYMPFTVRFPLVQLKKGAVSDKQVRRRHTRSPSSSGSSGSSPAIRPAEEQSHGIREFRPAEDIRREVEELDEDERALVIDVIAHPTSSVTERYGRLGLSADRGTKLTTRLVERGLLAKGSAATGRGRMVVLAASTKARKAVGDEEASGETNAREASEEPAAATDARRGGPEHEYWKHKIAEVLKADGYEVTFEARLENGHYVDVVAERSGDRIAVEVETGKSDVVLNIRRCLEDSFDRIVVVATSREAHHVVERKLRRAGQLAPPVELVRATDFVSRQPRQSVDEAA